MQRRNDYRFCFLSFTPLSVLLFFFFLLSITARAQAQSLGQLESLKVLKQAPGALRIVQACREAFRGDTDRAFHEPPKLSDSLGL